MTPINGVISIILVCLIFIGYGQAQLFEGSRCRLNDGQRGVCKNIEECQSIKEAIARNTIRFDNIVVCCFVGTVQIVCCSDEKPPKQHGHRPTVGPNTNTDFVFEQACAIESAAMWNPNRDVFVIYAAKVGFSDDFDSPIIAALQSYPNINFRLMNFETYSANTPVEKWFKTDQLFLSKYMISHTSDFLRYTSMFKFGGIYLDMDVVVQQSLESLPLNFAAAESSRFVAVGAIGFQPDDIGHKIAEMCAEDFAKNFNGREWGHNGPKVLTRVLKKLCNVEYTMDMLPEKCWGFKVFPQKAFYAIDADNWQKFFDSNFTQETLQVTNDSILVHVWNKLSSNQGIEKTAERTAYEVIAGKNCPKVFHASGDQF